VTVFVLNEDALLVCRHELGRVELAPAQDWVRGDGRRLLVEPDPEQRPIKGCPNIGPTIRPCQTTLKVRVGYSTFVRIDGRPICLDSVLGLTDGTPPGVVKYKVNRPGQDLVDCTG
jgi:hypothetical protein